VAKRILIVGTLDTKGKVLLPLRGWSEADREGGPLYDPQADEAFAEEMKKRLKPQIEVVEVDTHLNDPLYAETAVALLEEMISGTQAGAS
jgi:uncharacterized protein (UPF0261 family)